MNKKSYSEKLRDPRWQKLRLEILNRDGFACQLCSDCETELHIHHEEYRGNPWEADPDKLRTFCKHCHLEVEALKGESDSYDLTIFKVTGCDGVSDRIMLIALENITRMRVYDPSDRLICEHDLGTREMLLFMEIFNYSHPGIIPSRPKRLSFQHLVNDYR